MQMRFTFLTLLLNFAFFGTEAQRTSPWTLNGNSNATPASKLGTTNAVPLNFTTNNQTRLRIDVSGNVGIGTATTDASALLDVNSTTKGLLPPRMTQAQRDAIASPAQGLLVYQSDGTPGFYYYDGAWKAVTPSFTGANTSLSNLSSPTAVNQHLLPNATATRDLGAEALKWRRAYLSDGVSIGTVYDYAAVNLANAAERIGIYIENNYRGNTDLAGVQATSVQGEGWGYGVDAVGGYVGVNATGQGGSSTGYVYGLSGTATGSAGTRFGVLGSATGGNFNYGVYGTAYGGTTDYAGYFNGPIYATNITTTSDRKFKSDIQPLTSGLEQLLKLRPATYQYKTKEYKHMNLPEGRQLGLVADEVKQVFPQLVLPVVQPAHYDKNDRTKQISPEVKFEGVNYQGLIPVLIASVQELNKKTEEIEELKKELADLKQLVSKLANSQSFPTSISNAALLQNMPNPARGITAIRYSLPEGAKRAQLLLTDGVGRTIKAVQLNSSGTLNMNLSGLSSGVYNYSLVVDGKTVQTKKMTVER